MLTPDQLSQYTAARDRAAFATLPRTQVLLTGNDRATLLHKFCTQEVLALQPGQGGEAFICTVQGKILGYVYFFVGAGAIVLDSAPSQADTLIKHLDKYVIREDVQFTDLSAAQREVVVVGPRAAEALTALAGQGPPAALYAHTTTTIAGCDVALRRTPYIAGDCFFLAVAEAQVTTLCDALRSAGVASSDEAVIDALRIESATPLYGIDISIDNLPQEIARDAQAIHFRKGCYLGQETVARIDALGHVNKLLVPLALGEKTPVPVGTELLAGDKVVGRITSSAWSPQQQRWLALGFVRREHAKPSSKLQSTAGEAEVLAAN